MALPPQKPGRSDAPPDPFADKRAAEELAETVSGLEEELEALKARFEMYFLGVERREPSRDRDDLKRRIERVKGVFTRNTGLKFRVQSLAARFLSYERMWVRSAREKEEGTYRRDLFKARRHRQEQRAHKSESSTAPRAEEKAAAAPPGPDLPPPVPGTTPRAPPAPPPAAAPPPLPALSPPTPRPASVDDAPMRAIYDAYIEAKKRCNEDVSRLSYEAVTKSIQKQIPELLARYKARSVEFKVVIQGGKAILKAVPRS